MSLLANIVTLASVEAAVMKTSAIIAADLQTGEILYATPTAEKLFGYNVVGEMYGRQVEELLPFRFREDHVFERSRYAADPNIRAPAVAKEVTGMRKDGTEIEVFVSLAAAVIEISLPKQDQRPCVVATIMCKKEFNWR